MAVHSFREKDNLSGLPHVRMDRQVEAAQTAIADTRKSGKKNRSRSNASGDTSRVAIRIGKGLFDIELESDSKGFIVSIVLLVFLGVTGLLVLMAYLNGFALITQ